MLTVAALQFHPGLLDCAGNRMRIATHLAACDAQLAVLPELATSGYAFASREEAMSCSETTTGEAATLLRDTARDRGMAIVAGFVERAGDTLYNSALTVLPDGALHVYRKTHLFGREPEVFAEGDTGFVPVQWREAVLGIMICYDWRFPEAPRTLALRGAEILCHPSDLVAAPELWKPVMRTRSFESKVFTITANRIGTEVQDGEELTFHGSSQITAQNGTVLAEADRTFEGWITAEVDPARTRDKSFSPRNDIFSDRRPRYYAC